MASSKSSWTDIAVNTAFMGVSAALGIAVSKGMGVLAEKAVDKMFDKKDTGKRKKTSKDGKKKKKKKAA